VTEEQFWALIEQTRHRADGVLSRQVDLLRQHLLMCPRDELLGFHDCWEAADARAFTWPLWDASCLLLGYVSDDFFADVRAWIISHGRAALDNVVADPDRLVDLANDVDGAGADNAEGLTMLVWHVWQEKCGDEDLPESPSTRHDPAGERIDLTDEQAVRARFPRLAGRRHRLG
jgi:hypothetical protein